MIQLKVLKSMLIVLAHGLLFVIKMSWYLINHSHTVNRARAK